MTTPKKGDLVIVREKKGAFKKDALHLAEIDTYHNGSFVVRVLSDGRLLGGWPDHDRHAIEQVIPKEKLPKPIGRMADRYFQGADPVWGSASQWIGHEGFCKHYPTTPDGFWHTEVDWKRHEFTARWTMGMIEGYKREVAPSLYPLETGDEVEVYQHDRATGLYSGEPGRVVSRREHTAVVKCDFSKKTYTVDIHNGLVDGCRTSTWVKVTRKHKTKQDMCNNKFEYKVGQRFFTPSGRRFEVVSIAGDIAYARLIGDYMWMVRICHNYKDDRHVCVDAPEVSFMLIEPPLVVEAKELIDKLKDSHHKIEAADNVRLHVFVDVAKKILQ